jgi:hypothetical protein
MHDTMKFLSALCCTVALFGAADAAVISARAPYADAASGQQSDAAAPAFVQSFSAPAGAVLEAIRWWGFHGDNSLGATFDHFVVTLDGVAQSGTLSIVTGSLFDEYSLDVEWFWQSATALLPGGDDGAPDPADVGFSLIGHLGVASVAEPGTVPLSLFAMAMAMIGWLGSRRSAGK